jgi:maltose alpha-D-glucosyltransferase/alpha-amylase
VHNLGPDAGVVDLSSLYAEAESPNDVLADREYPDLGKFREIEVAGYGYRWIRLRRYS